MIRPTAAVQTREIPWRSGDAGLGVRRSLRYLNFVRDFHRGSVLFVAAIVYITQCW